MTDWRTRMDDVDAALLNEYQRELPLTERPFREVATGVGTTETAVVNRLVKLVEDGLIRRVGPVLNPPVIGSSTLAALTVPPARFEEVSAVVNAFDQVNHNYERDHEYNMWFVVTAPTRARRTAILERIGERTGLDVLVLPMLTEYDIDLTFPVVNDDRVAREARVGQSKDITPTSISETATNLSPFERRVVQAVQEGLPLETTPYRSIGADLDAPTVDVLDALRRLRSFRAIKRIGCVVDHHALGFTSNCMVVWAVPPGTIDRRAVRVAGHPAVTYCCRRRSQPDRDWPFTLFTMIHGRSRDAVDDVIDELAGGPLPVELDRLHTETVLKQTGVRYGDLLGENAGVWQAAETTRATHGRSDG